MNSALLLVDIQNDFLPGGALAVHQGDSIIPAANRLLALFDELGLPVAASRDWHPADHCSFEGQGGIWPPHCVANTPGAEFAKKLHLPDTTLVISKGTTADQEAYSAFQDTELASHLKGSAVTHLVVGGLATDYCVKNTVLDALEAGFEVSVVREAVKAVDLAPQDGSQALTEMQAQGAQIVSAAEIEKRLSEA
jgi:nicotinamidase/pyrazinamidase